MPNPGLNGYVALKQQAPELERFPAIAGASAIVP